MVSSRLPLYGTNWELPFPKVMWHKLVWFSGHISKCSFVTWITIQNRLSTMLLVLCYSVLPGQCYCFVCYSCLPEQAVLKLMLLLLFCHPPVLPAAAQLLLLFWTSTAVSSVRLPAAPQLLQLFWTFCCCCSTAVMIVAVLRSPHGCCPCAGMLLMLLLLLVAEFCYSSNCWFCCIVMLSCIAVVNYVC